MTNTITLPRSVVEQALEALAYYEYRRIEWDYKDDQAIDALRAALKQPQVKQEPVAWQYDFEIDGEVTHDWLTTDYDEAHNPKAVHYNIRPLYTHPQPPRQPLTDEQIREIEGWFSNEFGLEAKHAVDFARAIERAHGIGGEV